MRPRPFKDVDYTSKLSAAEKEWLFQFERSRPMPNLADAMLGGRAVYSQPDEAGEYSSEEWDTAGAIGQLTPEVELSLKEEVSRGFTPEPMFKKWKTPVTTRHHWSAKLDNQRGWCRIPRQGKASHYLTMRWTAMLQRCYLPSKAHYNTQGGRGIRVCGRWFYSFKAFVHDLEKMYGGEIPRTVKLRRIDRNKDWSPDNVKLVQYRR